MYIPPDWLSGVDVNSFGGLILKNDNPDEIATELGVFAQHIPELIRLIKNDVKGVLGGIYLQLTDNDELQVKWVERGSGHIRTRTLGRRK